MHELGQQEHLQRSTTKERVADTQVSRDMGELRHLGVSLVVLDEPLLNHRMESHENWTHTDTP